MLIINYIEYFTDGRFQNSILDIWNAHHGRFVARDSFPIFLQLVPIILYWVYTFFVASWELSTALIRIYTIRFFYFRFHQLPKYTVVRRQRFHFLGFRKRIFIRKYWRSPLQCIFPSGDSIFNTLFFTSILLLRPINLCVGN